jgi:hypothetical protein
LLGPDFLTLSCAATRCDALEVAEYSPSAALSTVVEKIVDNPGDLLLLGSSVRCNGAGWRADPDRVFLGLVKNLDNPGGYHEVIHSQVKTTPVR